MNKTVVGCEYLFAAPISSDAGGGLPTYGTGFEVAQLASADEAVTVASGELWLNGSRKHYRSKFTGGTFTPTMDELDAAASIALLGCRMDGTKLVYGENDKPPYVGIATIEELENEDDETFFRCTAYLKAKAKLSNKSAKTKENGVTFQTRQLPFELFSDTDGDWKVEEELTTLAAALAWCRTLLNVATVYRVDVMVQGDGISADKDGTNFVASGGNLVITVTGTPTAVYDNGVAVTLTDGAYTISSIAANHEIAIIKTA